MAKSSKEGKKSTQKQEAQPIPGAWIKMRTGLVVISMLSIAMAVLTAWEAVPQKGWVEGILWGVLFGGSIWVIFLAFVLYGRLFRRS